MRLYKVVTRGLGGRVWIRLVRCQEAEILAAIDRAGSLIESVRRFGDGRILH